MSDIFYGEVESVSTITGQIEVVDFMPHLIEDSNGDIIIDSNENPLNDFSPEAQTKPFTSDLILVQPITGDLITN